MADKSIQSLGGEARAKALTPEERTRIAQIAAGTRWKTPKATHQGVLTISKINIPCFVLEDGTRVISQRGLQESVGMSSGGAAKAGTRKLNQFVAQFQANATADNELPARLNAPLVFQPPHGGRTGFGYEATLLSDICEFILQCRDDGKLSRQQEKYARASEMILRALAKVGIIALVDEATGYQEIRDRLALQKILEMFISKELISWTKRFPDDFYREMFRLKNWDFPRLGTSKPQVVGHYTNDIVYHRLAPAVLDELKRLNPPDEKGNRPYKHHQWLTPDIGHPKLRDHISGVIALMKSADDWTQFKKMLKKVYPKKRIGETIEMEFK